ncbi:hypothetical protein BLAT2472_40643 [Burkholderia latens]
MTVADGCRENGPEPSRFKRTGARKRAAMCACRQPDKTTLSFIPVAICACTGGRLQRDVRGWPSPLPIGDSRI